MADCNHCWTSVPPPTAAPSPNGAPQVDLWLLNTSSLTVDTLTVLERCLSPEERDRLRVCQRMARRQFLLSRGCLRHLLGHYTGQPPDALTFDYGASGKPALGGGEALQFNLSHSGTRLLIGVSRAAQVTAIGVDIESCRAIRYLPELCRRYLSKAEAQRVLDGPADTASDRFLRYWTAKEAYLKALGLGIGDGMAQLVLTLPEDDAPLEPVGLAETALVDPPVHLYQWQPEPGYLAAVAVQSPLLNPDSFRRYAITPGTLLEPFRGEHLPG